MVKVLHIIPALGQGGAERLASELTARAPPDMHHVVVSMVGDSPFFPMSHVRVENLGLERGRFSLKAVRAFRTLVRVEKPDVVQGWLYHGNILASLARGLGPKIFWSIHNTSLDRAGSKRLTRALNKVAALASSTVPDCIIYCADAARRYHEVLGYDPSRGLVIQNGVDIQAFRRDDAARAKGRAALEISETEVLCGFVGRFDAQKSIPLLLQAFRSASDQRPRMKLVLAGEGFVPNNDDIRGLLAEFQVEDNTILLGACRDVPALLSSLDLITFASSYGEALPMAALEAAAAGLPIVTTDVGETRRLTLSPDHIVRARNPDALAGALVQACDDLTNGTLEDALKRRHRLLQQEFDLDTALQTYAALYRKTAEARALGHL